MNLIEHLVARGRRQAAAQADVVPHVELAYRGAIEVLSERLADAWRPDPTLRSATAYLMATPGSLSLAAEDLVNVICPLWPFC